MSSPQMTRMFGLPSGIVAPSRGSVASPLRSQRYAYGRANERAWPNTGSDDVTACVAVDAVGGAGGTTCSVVQTNSPPVTLVGMRSINGDRDVARNWLKVGPRQRWFGLIRWLDPATSSPHSASAAAVDKLLASLRITGDRINRRCRERDIPERPVCLEEDGLDSIAVIRRNILRLRSSGSRSLILRQVSAQGPGLGASHRHTAVRRRTRIPRPSPPYHRTTGSRCGVRSLTSSKVRDGSNDSPGCCVESTFGTEKAVAEL